MERGDAAAPVLMGRVDVVPCKTTVASDSTSESGSGIWLLRVEGTATTRRWVDGAVKCFFRRRRHWPPPLLSSSHCSAARGRAPKN